MPAPPEIPGAPKGKKSRKWLLYAAGAGVLLALIFLLRKKAPAEPETSRGGTLTAAEGAGLGAEGAGTPAAAAPAPSLNLGGALNPGETVSGRAASAGGEVEASRSREAINAGEAAAAAGASPEAVRAAEVAAYHRGVAIVKKQDKEKAAAAKARAAVKKTAPKPSKAKPHPQPRAHAKAAPRPRGKPAPIHKAAPRPHKK